MKSCSTEEAAHQKRGLSRPARWALDHITKVWNWRWSKPLGEAIAAALGLLLLAVIGRSTLARSAITRPENASALMGPPAPVPAKGQIPLAASAQPAVAPPQVDGPAPLPTLHGRATPDDPVFINQASLEDLRRLPGVGAKRALAIMALKAKLGRFRQIEDLLKVKGIGRASLKKLRPLVRVDAPVPQGPTTP